MVPGVPPNNILVFVQIRKHICPNCQMYSYINQQRCQVFPCQTIFFLFPRRPCQIQFYFWCCQVVLMALDQVSEGRRSRLLDNIFFPFCNFSLSRTISCEICLFNRDTYFHAYFDERLTISFFSFELSGNFGKLSVLETWAHREI